MSETISRDRILIVPNYTDAEIKLLKDSKKRKQVKPLISYYFQCMDLEFKPRRKNYEEFNSSQGKILIEKACDEFPTLEISVSVYQQMSVSTDKVTLSSNAKPSPVRTALSTPGYLLNEKSIDTSTLTGTGNNDDAWGTNPDFIELRRGFFDYLIGRPLTIVSALHPPMSVAFITDLSYSMGEGQEDATYKITFSEVLSG